MVEGEIKGKVRESLGRGGGRVRQPRMGSGMGSPHPKVESDPRPFLAADYPPKLNVDHPQRPEKLLAGLGSPLPQGNPL